MTLLTRLNLFIMLVWLAVLSPFSRANGTNLPTTIPDSESQQLASNYREGIDIKNYWVSEKLDGIRARWTGSKLITRNGHTIYAPTWFVKGFPANVLEGELWIGRNSFEQTASITLRNTPTDEWKNIKFMLFDLPKHKGDFTRRLAAMKNLVKTTASSYLQVIPQFKLSNQKQLMQTLDDLVDQGAEGLMLHHQDAYYQDGRTNHLLKLKKHMDAEARVIGHIEGKGKYKNMLGSLLVELDNGVQFKIGSGLSDAQRRDPPAIGTIITFKYLGLTAKGIPRFASFLRVRQGD